MTSGNNSFPDEVPLEPKYDLRIRTFRKREREKEIEWDENVAAAGLGQNEPVPASVSDISAPAVKVISVLPPDRPTYCHRLHNLPCYLLTKLIYYSTIISARPIDYRRWNEDVLCTLPWHFATCEALPPPPHTHTPDYVKERLAHVTKCYVCYTRVNAATSECITDRESGVSDTRRDSKRGCA